MNGHPFAVDLGRSDLEAGMLASAFEARHMMAWQPVTSLLRCRHASLIQPQLEELFMTRRIIYLLIAAASGIGAVPLFAQGEATAPAGTLTLDKKTYTLKRALAY